MLKRLDLQFFSSGLRWLKTRTRALSLPDKSLCKNKKTTSWQLTEKRKFGCAILGVVIESMNQPISKNLTMVEMPRHGGNLDRLGSVDFGIFHQP